MSETVEVEDIVRKPVFESKPFAPEQLVRLQAAASELGRDLEGLAWKEAGENEMDRERVVGKFLDDESYSDLEKLAVMWALGSDDNKFMAAEFCKKLLDRQTDVPLVLIKAVLVFGETDALFLLADYALHLYGDRDDDGNPTREEFPMFCEAHLPKSSVEAVKPHQHKHEDRLSLHPIIEREEPSPRFPRYEAKAKNKLKLWEAFPGLRGLWIGISHSYIVYWGSTLIEVEKALRDNCHPGRPLAMYLPQNRVTIEGMIEHEAMTVIAEGLEDMIEQEARLEEEDRVNQTVNPVTAIAEGFLATLTDKERELVEERRAMVRKGRKNAEDAANFLAGLTEEERAIALGLREKEKEGALSGEDIAAAAAQIDGKAIRGLSEAYEARRASEEHKTVPMGRDFDAIGDAIKSMQSDKKHRDSASYGVHRYSERDIQQIVELEQKDRIMQAFYKTVQDAARMVVSTYPEDKKGVVALAQLAVLNLADDLPKPANPEPLKVGDKVQLGGTICSLWSTFATVRTSKGGGPLVTYVEVPLSELVRL